MCRIELPRTKQYVNRFIFSLQLDRVKPKNCCTNSDTICWLNEQQLTQAMRFGTIPDSTVQQAWCAIECAQLLNWSHSRAQRTVAFREVAVNERLLFLEEKSEETSLLNNLGFEKQDVEFMLNQFIITCYPSETMSFAAFCKFIGAIWPSRRQIEHVNLNSLFNAFDVSHRRALTFKELLLGLAIQDETVLIWAQGSCQSMTPWLSSARNGYIFRYYDFNLDGRIDANELLNMLNDYAKGLAEVNQMPIDFSILENRRRCGEEMLDTFGHPDASGQMCLQPEQLVTALHQLTEKWRTAESDPDIFNLQSAVLSLPINVNSLSARFAYSKIPPRSEHVSFCSQDDYVQ